MTPQTILITGATSGIGRDAALHLAAAGHRVFGAGRNATALAELGDAGVEPLALDVTDPNAIAAARDEVDRRTDGRGLDALVNNAGYGTVGPLLEISDEELRAQFETNVFGLMAMTRAFLPPMRARRAGRIVNVGSMAGLFTFPFFGAYNATKYAIESMSDALRMELAPFGIHVALIEPGTIRTNFAGRSLEALDRNLTDDSPYQPVLSRRDRIERLAMVQAVGPRVITRVIEEALTARRPRARYMAPLRGRLAIALMRSLPTRLADDLIARVTGLTARNLA